mmetsp:Transcript_27757/g.43320  ORF Transcript_27757/g.43320 Transcript_27757/m.43320 type:complete len:335 (-) Transcript_27757:14-1018(-)
MAKDKKDNKEWINAIKMAAVQKPDADSDGTISPPSSDNEEVSLNHDDIDSIKQMFAMEEKAQGALKDVDEFAKYLGMDPTLDKQFLWIAVEAMTAPLPANWAEYQTEDGSTYYYNQNTDTTQWEHPMDEYHRHLFQKLKAEKGEDGQAGSQPLKKQEKRKKKRNSINQPAGSETFDEGGALVRQSVDGAENKDRKKKKMEEIAKKKELLQKAQKLAEDAERLKLQQESEAAARQSRQHKEVKQDQGAEEAERLAAEKKRLQAERKAAKKAKIRDKLKVIKAVDDEGRSSEEGSQTQSKGQSPEAAVPPLREKLGIKELELKKLEGLKALNDRDV